MSKETVCYLVLGVSLGVILQGLTKRQGTSTEHQPRPDGPGEVIDLAAWKELHRRSVATGAK